MIKKTITYVDYNGVERTEDFYFNLTKAELTEMELSQEGGLENKFTKIIQAQNMAEIVETFKDLILRSYGEKSDDGRRFIKNEELSTAFSQTEAYNELFMKLATDAKAATDFVEGIMPADFANEIKQQAAKTAITNNVNAQNS